MLHDQEMAGFCRIAECLETKAGPTQHEFYQIEIENQKNSIPSTAFYNKKYFNPYQKSRMKMCLCFMIQWHELC